MIRASIYRGTLLLLAVLAATLGAAQPAHAQDSRGPDLDTRRLAVVKAGMVINFVRYTTWPESAFAGEGAPIVVTIVGENGIDEALAAAARGRLVENRPIEVRRVEHPGAGGGHADTEAMTAFHESLRGSHAVFFGRGEQDRFRETLLALAGDPILTISDIPGFAQEGGMLGLAIRESRVAFDACEQTIKAGPLRLSSQVLKLARIVEPRESPDGGAGEGGGR